MDDYPTTAAQPLEWRRKKVTAKDHSAYATIDGRYEIEGRPSRIAGARGGSVAAGKVFVLTRHGSPVSHVNLQHSKLMDAKAEAQRDIEMLERAHNDARQHEAARIAGDPNWAEVTGAQRLDALTEDIQRKNGYRLPVPTRVVEDAVAEHFARHPVAVADAVAWRGEIWEVFSIEDGQVHFGDYEVHDRCDSAPTADLWPATPHVTHEQHETAAKIGLEHVEGYLYRVNGTNPLGGIEVERSDGSDGRESRWWLTAVADRRELITGGLATFAEVLDLLTYTNPPPVRQPTTVASATETLAEIARTLDVDTGDLPALTKLARLAGRFVHAVDAVADHMAVQQISTIPGRSTNIDTTDLNNAQAKRDAMWRMLAETLVREHRRN